MGAFGFLTVINILFVFGITVFLLFMVFRVVKAFERIAAAYEKKNNTP